MPEMKDVFDVAVELKAKLEAAGYTVLMTKNAYTDTVTKRQRADLADNNNAALAVSIHTSGHVFGQYGRIYVQTLTSYRENIQGQKVYFTNAAVAALSAQYGQIFLAERRAIEGSSVVVTVNGSFDDRGLAPGNIPIVQLFFGSSLDLQRSRRASERPRQRPLRPEPVQQHREVCPYRRARLLIADLPWAAARGDATGEVGPGAGLDVSTEPNLLHPRR